MKANALLSIKQLAELLRVSPDTIRRGGPKRFVSLKPRRHSLSL
jgi:hypothetical protein